MSIVNCKSDLLYLSFTVSSIPDVDNVYQVKMIIVRQSPILRNYFTRQQDEVSCTSSGYYYFFPCKKMFRFAINLTPALEQYTIFLRGANHRFDVLPVYAYTKRPTELLKSYVSNFDFMTNLIDKQRSIQKSFLQESSKIKAALVDIR